MSITAIADRPAEPLPHAHAAAITARIDRLPENRHTWRLAALISLAGMFEVYDLYQTAYVPTGLVRSGIFSEGAKGLFGLPDQAAFASSTFLGLFIGAIGFASVADRFGRKTIFLWALVGYSIATLVMALQSTANGILACRLLAGIGLGVELVTIDAYLVEIVPKQMRGKAAAIMHAIAYLALPLVAFVSYLLIPLDPLGVASWRWVVLIGAGGAAFVWWLRVNLPESPRWLAQHGNIEAADRIVSEIERQLEQDLGHALPAPAPEIVDVSRRASFAEIWQPPYRQRTIMLMAFNFFQTIGFFGFTNWLPTLLAAQGHSITRSLLYSAVIAVAYPLWAVLWGFTVAERYERKWQIVVASGATAVLGLIFAMLTVPSLLILCGTLIVGANTLMSYAYHPYQAELYPTEVRARAVGFVYSFSRLSTVFTSFIIAFLLRDFGAQWVFLSISLSMFVVMGSIGIYGPRTRGRSLEDIAR
ncbi:MFS transporter [Bradyrhizobium sp. BR 10261]|uniref:MFS transporter n=1 Tax=Bradyrhizobium sp. BR 10261 TaxID=2749992 RepID=UPI0028970B9D|nr:MFS transporter [Bradyrhizobium sp. BR 10261]